MATRQQEAFLEHTSLVAKCACANCGTEEENWDEMDLVNNIMEKGWVVHDKKLFCPKCRVGEYTSSTGHKFDTIKMDDAILDKDSPLVGVKIFIPKGK
jgi:Zn finger protein HypA/HybF involved in hydrogenase expression